MDKFSKMRGWYFATKDCRLRYGDGRVAKVGVTHRVKGLPDCCFHGLHASARALDALRLGAGPVPFRVTLSGAMDHSYDKSAAQRRTYDRGGIDLTNTLVEFACCWAAPWRRLCARAAAADEAESADELNTLLEQMIVEEWERHGI